MTERSCIRCGAPLRPGQNYCLACGTVQTSLPVAVPPPEAHRRRIGPLASAASVLAAVILLLVLRPTVSGTGIQSSALLPALPWPGPVSVSAEPAAESPVNGTESADRPSGDAPVFPIQSPPASPTPSSASTQTPSPFDPPTQTDAVTPADQSTEESSPQREDYSTELDWMVACSQDVPLTSVLPEEQVYYSPHRMEDGHYEVFFAVLTRRYQGTLCVISGQVSYYEDLVMHDSSSDMVFDGTTYNWVGYYVGGELLHRVGYQLSPDHLFALGVEAAVILHRYPDGLYVTYNPEPPIDRFFAVFDGDALIPCYSGEGIWQAVQETVQEYVSTNS